jgi:hypothetical protein
MDDERRAAVTDDAITREIERALQVKPGPAFVAEVRSRVARESVTSDWKRHWMVLATSAALVVTIAAGWAVSWFRMTPGPELIPRPMPSTSTAVAEPSPRVTPLEPTPTPPPQRLASTNTRRAPRQQTAPPRAHVLISQSEAAALRRFLDEATRRPLSIVVEGPGSADLMPTAFGNAEIVIPPIVIEPLETSSTEGVKP